MLVAAPLVAALADATAPAAEFPASASLPCRPPAVWRPNAAAPLATDLNCSPKRDPTATASWKAGACFRLAAYVAIAPVAATYTGFLTKRALAAGTSAKVLLAGRSACGSLTGMRAKVYLPVKIAAAATVA